jgi:aspartyl-tRNA(Asn)/glutamyl-tRNA(Gln) amidotransferase subunit A
MSVKEVTVEPLTRDGGQMHGAFETICSAAMHRDLVLGRYRHRHPSGKSDATLAGVTVGVKSVIAVRGLPCTGSCAAVGAHRVGADAEIVTRLRRAGALITGTTTSHELAYGPTGDRSFPAPARNPIDEDRIPGGSSSGSAVAVALGVVDIALGTDTGGSTRIPASCCGVVGMKPTRLSLPMRGVRRLSPTFDQPGILSRDVEVNRRVWRVAAGRERDPSSGYETTASFPRDSLAGARVGLLAGYFSEASDAEVRLALDRFAGQIEQLGTDVTECCLDGVGETVKAHRLIVSHEAYAVYRHLIRERRSLPSDETYARLAAGASVDSSVINGARERIALFRSGLRAKFEAFDYLVCPTIPVLPPSVADVQASPESRGYWNDMLTRYTSPFNTADNPAISVPVRPGNPVGMQIVGRVGDDERLYELAAAIMSSATR